MLRIMASRFCTNNRLHAEKKKQKNMNNDVIDEILMAETVIKPEWTAFSTLSLPKSPVISSSLQPSASYHLCVNVKH